MIKKFKSYNTQFKELQVGDWIIDEDGDVGRITQVSKSKPGYDSTMNVTIYYVLFPDIPENVTHPVSMFDYQFKHHGTKEEMEIIKNASTYNL